MPGIIRGFLLPRLGPGRLRYAALTGRVFSTDDALRGGLVHAVAESEAELDELVEQHIGYALAASPDAIADCKLLLNEVGPVSMRPVTTRVLRGTSRRAAQQQARKA